MADTDDLTDDDVVLETPAGTSNGTATPAESGEKWESPFETAERAHEALEEADDEILDEIEGVGPGTIEMPSHFPEHLAEKWQSWPDDLRESLIEMHGEMAEEASRWVNDAKRVMQQTDGIRKAVEPYAAKLTWAAGSVENALNRVLMIYDRYLDNPQEAIQFLAKEAGIDLAQMGQQGQRARQQQWASMTPAERALAQEVERLRRVQDDQVRREQAASAAMTQRTRTRYAAAIDDMRNRLDKDGNPAHPFFDDVRHEMAELVRAQVASGQAPDLEAAYREAVYRNPEVRERYLEQEFAARQKQKAARLEQARAKSQSLRSGGGQPRDRSGRYVALDNESAEDTARRIALDLGFM